MGKLNFSKYIGNLPSSYQESLSYQEQLNWLCKYIDDYIKALDELQEYVDKYLVDMEDVKADIATLKTQVIQLRLDVDTNTQSIVDLKSYTDSKLYELNTSLREIINGNYNALKSYIDNNVNDLQNQIDNINIGATIIYNPITGERDTVQNVINDLYQTTNTDGIEAGEFDVLELTASEFDSKELTAREFDTEGKILLTQ